MSEEVQYTIVGENGQQYGPMNLEDLKTLCRDERVGPHTEVWDSTTKEWHQARQIEELAEFFPEEELTGEETTEAAVGEGAEQVTVPRSSSLALASLWCGVLAIPTFCAGGWILGLLAVIFGVIARTEERRQGFEPGVAATVGLVCGVFSLCLTSIFAAIFGGYFVEAVVRLLGDRPPL